ncbi:2TM domain-containing protein [Flavobacterium salilacus subsp. salilacus]|uniref:2TM domain-containing protein n=1 Tax=Flavobacterium TaxID=237 RepID=UPI0013C36778|nr:MULTISPECIES: 2TM domain-containing protein [Flavobacterium]KAF2516846.1 2TM domain-containing protein [Flavobacterium salilacus subsp. salilacus]MBE1615795.1 2TM domain-containing protein [Flavobacterium sp. SaA2.13]
MKKNHNNPEAYIQAEKKVTAIKGFYFNLLIYIITNSILIYFNLVYNSHFHWVWYSVLLWGIGMLLYGIVVFGYIPFMNRNWEERKLRELIEKENFKEQDINNVAAPLNKQIQYDRAKNRVRALRNFYRHLTAYILVIIVLLVVIWIGLQTGQDLFMYIAYGTALGWSIGLIVHVSKVFGTSLVMGKGWEERKLRALMEKEHEKRTKYK